jgi:hypothetical protein
VSAVVVLTCFLQTGNCGISVDLPAPAEAASPELSTYAALFAEELGLVLEVHPDKAALVSSLFNQAGVPCSIIGSVLPEQKVAITVAGEAAVSGNTATLRQATLDFSTILLLNTCLLLVTLAPSGCSTRVCRLCHLQFVFELEEGMGSLCSQWHQLCWACADVAAVCYVVCYRDVWEETSFALERLQAAEECVDQEQSGLKSRTAPTWKLPFTPAFTPADKMSSTDKVGTLLTCQQGLAPC